MLSYIIVNKDNYVVFLTTSLTNIKTWITKNISKVLELDKDGLDKDGLDKDGLDKDGLDKKPTSEQLKSMFELYKVCIVSQDDFDEEIDTCPTLSYENVYGTTATITATSRKRKRTKFEGEQYIDWVWHWPDCSSSSCDGMGCYDTKNHRMIKVYPYSLGENPRPYPI
jgi:hypothetical protein